MFTEVLNSFDYVANAKCLPIYAATDTSSTCISPVNGTSAGKVLQPGFDDGRTSSNLRRQGRCAGSRQR